MIHLWTSLKWSFKDITFRALQQPQRLQLVLNPGIYISPEFYKYQIKSEENY